LAFRFTSCILFYYDLFKQYFHLWGNGEPSWIRKAQIYAEEEFNSWTHVSSRRSRSYADAIKSAYPLTGAYQVAIGSRGSVFNHITYPRISAFQRLDFSSAPHSHGEDSSGRNFLAVKNTDELVSNSNAGLKETTKNTVEHVSNSNSDRNEAINLDLNLGGTFDASSPRLDQASDFHGTSCSRCLSPT